MYGRCRAYELVLHGDEIEWRAPLRRRRVALQSVVSADVRRGGGVRGERQGSLVTVTGEELLVVVPNARHERRFLALCAAIGRRVPSFVGPGG